MVGTSTIQSDIGRDGETDFRGVLATLLERKWLILFLTVLAGIAAVAFVNIVKPKYTGEARVILEYRDNYFTRPDKDMKGFEQPLDAEAVQSQVQAIMSRDLAKNVIKKLRLGELEEFDSLKRGSSTISSILSLLGIGKDQLFASPDDRVIEAYFEKLLVYNLGKSRVISIEFSSRDPELAARGANAVADEYIAMMAEAKKATTKGAANWLATTIEPMRLKVAEAEARVEAYRAQNGLLVGASNATVATQQLGELSTQMSNARTQQSELQAKSRIIREALRSGRIFETSEVVNNELIRRLLEQRVSMKTQIALEERTLLSGHPRMKELHAQLADLESQIRVAAERTARTFENDAKVSGAKVQSLQNELQSQKNTAAAANEAEVPLRALEREAKALRENYEQYLAKYRDSLARDADAASPADARVISRAAAPRLPSFPKKLPIILLATLSTLVLSSAIIMTRALFSTEGYEVPVRTADETAPRQARRRGRIPFFGRDKVPQLHPVIMPPFDDEILPVHVARASRDEPMPERKSSSRPIVGFAPTAADAAQQDAILEPTVAAPSAAVADAPVKVEASVATRAAPAAPVLPATPARPVTPATLAPPVAPAAPTADIALAPVVDDLLTLRRPGVALMVGVYAFGGDVVSELTAIPLARLLARRGTAVLVDCVGTNEIDAILPRASSTGLSDLTSGGSTYAQAIHRDGRSRLHVMPFGNADLAGQNNPTTGPFRDVLDALSQTYDFVVLSAGPLGDSLDALLPMQDHVLVVSSSDESNPDVSLALDEIEITNPDGVTLVIEEPIIATPRAANDRLSTKESVA